MFPSTPALDWLDAALVILALGMIVGSRRLGMWPYALMALPGTIAHEFAHYLVALVLGARPDFPSLAPVRNERGWRMGSVRFRAGALRAMPIALAPLALLPLAWFWTLHLLAPAQGWPLALHAWVVAACLAAGFPSPTDWRLAAPGLLGLAAVGGLLGALAWFAGWRGF